VKAQWLAVLAVTLPVVAGCGAQEAEVKTRSADVVFVDFLDTMDDVVKHSGTSWPEWDRSDTAGYVSEVCGVRAREDGRSYQRQIEGGPVKDPEGAVESMRAHWESQGYEIGNIFDDGDPSTGVQINARTPSGMLVQFSPTPNGSLIKVVSDCTLDPAARRKTS
jgi:hypothetical protein